MNKASDPSPRPKRRQGKQLRASRRRWSRPPAPSRPSSHSKDGGPGSGAKAEKSLRRPPGSGVGGLVSMDGGVCREEVQIN